MATKYPMVREKVSILKPSHFGPNNRRTPVETCVCGIQFTSYDIHRETAHHKRFIRAERAERRRKQVAKL